MRGRDQRRAAIAVGAFQVGAGRQRHPAGFRCGPRRPHRDRGCPGCRPWRSRRRRPRSARAPPRHGCRGSRRAARCGRDCRAPRRSRPRAISRSTAARSPFPAAAISAWSRLCALRQRVMAKARMASSEDAEHASCCHAAGPRKPAHHVHATFAPLPPDRGCYGRAMDQTSPPARSSAFAAVDLSRRLRHRRDRDELRDARLALPQPVFRQRHLHLGLADLDRAGGALRRLFHRRLARRPLSVGRRARRDRADRLGLHAGAARCSPSALLEFVLARHRRRARPAASPPPSRSCSFRSRFSACIRRSAIRLLLRSAQSSGTRVRHGLWHFDRSAASSARSARRSS